MRQEVLQACPLAPMLEAGLRQRFEVHRWPDIEDKDAWLRTKGREVRALVTSARFGVANALLEKLPALEMIALNGVGFDKIDLEFARRRGLKASYTPDVLTDDVADLALGLIISLLREIPAADRYVKDGLWLAGDMPLARKVTGKKFGIFGFGRIGAAIAARVSVLGPVAYTATADKANGYVFMPNLIDLARASDVLVIACNVSAETERAVGREVLDALGARGYLVNIARGEVVDEPEMIAALGDRRIAGAGLDVFLGEPDVAIRLRGLPNVVLTPHVGSATHETRAEMCRLVLANLDAHFAGEDLPTPLI